MACDNVTVIFVEDECLEATITEDALVVEITEVVDVVGSSGGTFDHNALFNRDIADQHPISAITGLSAALTTLTDEDIAFHIFDESATTVRTQADFNNYSWSSGAIEGFELTDNLDGTIDIAAGEIILRNSENPVAPLGTYVVSGVTGVTPTNNTVTYIYVDYNAGSPQIVINGGIGDFNCIDSCILYEIAREGTDIFYRDETSQNVNANTKLRRRYLKTNDYKHSSGGVISEVGTRNIQISALTGFSGLLTVDSPLLDTSGTDTLTRYYEDGVGGWTLVSGQTQIDNLYYDDGSGTLAVLGNNKWGVHYIFLAANGHDHISSVYGRDSYDSPEEALSAPVPAGLPTIASVSIYLGRIVIQKSASVFTEITNALETSETRGTATSHASLTNLSWVDSGHISTANSLAGFDSAGEAVAMTEEYSNLTELQQIRVDRVEPNGFIRSNSVTMGDVSFVTGTRTFTIDVQGGESSFSFYSNGKKYTKTSAQSVVILDIEGLHYIYFDNSGVLQTSQTIVDSIFLSYAMVATIYWDATNKVAITNGDERHGIRMSGLDHMRDHNTIGTIYEYGLNIDGLSDGGTGYTQTTSGQIWDEDIEHPVSAETTHKFLYRDGANGYWRASVADSLIAYDTGGNAVWNEDTGATWQLTALGSTNYAIMHFVATHNEPNHIFKIIGHNVYASRNAARSAIEEEINTLKLEGLPTPEILFLYSVIINYLGELQTLSDGSLFYDVRKGKLPGTGGASGESLYHADLLDTDNDGHPVTAITGLFYKDSFVDGDLTAGVLSVNHALNMAYPSAVTVWNNDGKIIGPDEITSVDVNNLTIDLSSYGTLTGTWNLSIIY